MKTVKAKTQCPCGTEVHVEIKKPKWFNPTLAKISCPNCKSKFFVLSEIDKESHGKVIRRTYKTSFEVIELTENAKTLWLKTKAIVRGTTTGEIFASKSDGPVEA